MEIPGNWDKEWKKNPCHAYVIMSDSMYNFEGEKRLS